MNPAVSACIDIVERFPRQGNYILRDPVPGSRKNGCEIHGVSSSTYRERHYDLMERLRTAMDLAKSGDPESVEIIQEIYELLSEGVS
jgi:hypothetical protein